jgi:hypothetical protein
MAMAVKLYEMKRLSSGMAEALVDMDRVSFLLALHRYGAAMSERKSNRDPPADMQKRPTLVKKSVALSFLGFPSHS